MDTSEAPESPTPGRVSRGSLRRFVAEALPVLLLSTMVVVGWWIEATSHPPLEFDTELPLVVLLLAYFVRVRGRL